MNRPFSDWGKLSTTLINHSEHIYHRECQDADILKIVTDKPACRLDVRANRVRAVDIASAIIFSIENLGLSLNNLRGQGYDGASTMSGERAGVQSRIRERLCRPFFKSCYIEFMLHCAHHQLH